MLILLPPSEGKSTPSRGASLRLERLVVPELTGARQEVLDALTTLCTGDPGKAAEVLGLGPTQAEEVRRNASLLEAPTARADQVYTGVLYEALDPRSLSTAARRRAASRLLITSGLFGLVRPQDPVPAYRLSADVALPGLGTVSSFWRARIASAFEGLAGDRLVVDLRSTGYAAFWRPTPERATRVVTVRVLHEVQGSRKVVSHFNKSTKGRLVRSLIEDGSVARTPTALATLLRDLGWTVEPGPASRHGVGLDVVVTDL